MKVTLEFPEKPELKGLNLVEYLLTKMYQDEIFSAGQCADVLHITKEEFIELLGKYQISVFGESAEDFLNDLNNA
ncbi:UPF0175 family protein [Algoriphagus hitonicola]|uniref:Uncharacterized protein family (UPF0175) n=1 Tax=Algoriphagus hitonicola TaxID=435880 RepID=A0A1I2U7Q1_9BACT|nr:UPF0175 family protein [Algoriphagus hitonicola]SFG71697.1 Uncharacterised protein family (UPF0175) [Algoriphagus hitonicola]